MKTTIKIRQARTLLFAAIAALLLFTQPIPAHALELPDTPHSEFLQEFVNGYRAGQTQYLTNTLRGNKRKVRAVVNTLIEEAKVREFNERMELLDIANAMASMHKHWNYDAEPLRLVEAVLEEEMVKERARADEAAKWASYEKFPGNVLYRSNPATLESAKVAPVIFPHWKHRLLYECSACHDSLFKIDRSSRNAKRPSLMHQAAYCGTCHDSKTAFGIMSASGSKENCNKCHSAGIINEKAQVYSAGAKQSKALKKSGRIATAIGGSFDPVKLKDGILPEDRFGDIDWVELGKSGAYYPAARVEPDKTAQKRKSHASSILFEVPDTASWIGAVPFRHKSHTPGIECATCHTSLYGKNLKAEKGVTMQGMAEGESCGACHNKVAFKLADCMRCHTNSLTEDELKRILKRDKTK